MTHYYVETEEDLARERSYDEVDAQHWLEWMDQRAERAATLRAVSPQQHDQLIESARRRHRRRRGRDRQRTIRRATRAAGRLAALAAASFALGCVLVYLLGVPA